MKNTWLAALVLAAGITLQATAQVSPKYQQGEDGRATADRPNKAYNSGGIKKGSGEYSGKMKHGVSRSGNSNLQTGSTKTGQEVNAPGVGTKPESAASTNNPSVTTQKNNSSGRAGRASAPSNTSTTQPANSSKAMGAGSTTASSQSANPNASKGSTTGPKGPGGSNTNAAGGSKKADPKSNNQ